MHNLGGSDVAKGGPGQTHGQSCRATQCRSSFSHNRASTCETYVYTGLAECARWNNIRNFFVGLSQAVVAEVVSGLLLFLQLVKIEGIATGFHDHLG